jgi:hypothetical protein
VKFKLGRIVITRGAIAHCEEQKINPLDLLSRHAAGDWGDLCDDDKAANESAIVGDYRIVSAYGDCYVITEWDRSVTTILLKTEY